MMPMSDVLTLSTFLLHRLCIQNIFNTLSREQLPLFLLSLQCQLYPIIYNIILYYTR